MLFLAITTVHAQNEKDYKPLVDSLVRNYFYANLDLKESVETLKKRYKNVSSLGIEYGFAHNKETIDLLNKVVEKTSDAVQSEEDYQALLDYYKKSKRANDIMNSGSFQVSFGQRLKVKLAETLTEYIEHKGYWMLEMGKYEILDKEFESAFYAYWNSGSKDIYEGAFKAIGEELAGSRSGDKQLLVDFMKSLREALPNYLCLTLMEYCTVEELKSWNDNSQMATLQKELLGEAMGFLQKILEAPQKWESEVIETARSVTPTKLAEYAYKTRGIERTPVKKHSRIVTIPWMKGTYTGEIFNTLPHGKGTYTDKKGVRYTGDWMNGKRHGYITQFKTNGDSIRSLWAGDKVLKGKPKVEKGFRGMFYKDKPFGPGIRYNNDSKEEGMFIDGELHGKGKRIMNDGTEIEGLFEHGIPSMKTTIRVKEGNNTYMAEGDFDIQLTGTGTRTIITSTGKALLTGSFTNGSLDGFGEIIYIGNDKDTVTYRGTFAYGKQMGRGYYTQTPTDKRSRVVYNGLIHEYDFLDGDIHRITNWQNENSWNHNYKGAYNNEKYHGKGLLLMTNNGDTIRYEGGFKEGIFEGYGEYSSKTFTYKGDFKDGQIHGKGVSTNQFGQTLECEWQNGTPYGNCKVTFKNGDTLEGTYSYGNITGKKRNKNNRIISQRSSIKYEYNYRYLTK